MTQNEQAEPSQENSWQIFNVLPYNCRFARQSRTGTNLWQSIIGPKSSGRANG